MVRNFVHTAKIVDRLSGGRIWGKWKMSEICCKGTGAPETRCEYDDAWFCKNPDCKTPVLTSTMLGAHPSGCPKIYEWNRRTEFETQANRT